jgi:hypothetical protein
MDAALENLNVLFREPQVAKTAENKRPIGTFGSGIVRTMIPITRVETDGTGCQRTRKEPDTSPKGIAPK